MFGLLRAPSCALSPLERESYRADFCSLCHSLRQQDGFLSSLLTNSDSTFWLMVAGGMAPQAPTRRSAPCTAMPLRQVLVAEHDSEVARANLSLLWLLVRAKAEDDRDDEGSWKARAALQLVGGKASLAEQHLRGWGVRLELWSGLPARQRAAEAQPEPTFGEVSRPTIEMMGEAFALQARVCRRPETEAALRNLGTALGACIYLLDALDDHERDRRQGHFNPVFFCPDSRTRPQIARLAQERLQALLSSTSASLTGQVVLRLRRRLLQHPLLGGSAPQSRPRLLLRRLRQAAFCLPPGLGLRSGEDQQRDHCCSQCCDCCDCAECCSCGSDTGCCEGGCGGAECCSGCDCCGACSC
jgi:hypothetical protein